MARPSEAQRVATSRFQLIDDGAYPLPGKCACCGTVKGRMLDFGFTLDYYGAVLLCIPCCVSAIQVAGFNPEPQTVLPTPEFDTEEINELLTRINPLVARLISVLPDSDLEFPEIDGGTDEADGETVSDPLLSDGAKSPTFSL